MAIFFGTIYLLMTVVASRKDEWENVLDCDLHCNCSSSKSPNSDAICTGNTLTYIPRFPKYVTGVTIKGANLSNIGKDGFLNVTDHIYKINLTDNLITFIDSKALTNMTQLKSLSIANEPNLDIEVLKGALSNISTSTLKTLHLTNNKWTRLPIDMFYFANSKLSNLLLTGNKFQSINFTVFEHLSGLTSLKINDNEIEQIYITHMPYISELWLNNNLLSVVPNWCLYQSLMPKLITLSLAQNIVKGIEHNSFTGKCLPSVEKIDIGANKIKNLKDNVFATLPNLLHLDLSNNQLKEIQKFAFNSSSLLTLVLKQTRFHFDYETYNPKTVFEYCPNLQTLDLTDNYFWLANSTLLQDIFRPLEKLRKLILQGTELSFLPENIFTRFKDLETLQLQNNKIFKWEESDKIFGNLSNLTTLDLSNNLLSVINQTSFPNAILSSLKVLDLTSNPFSCTCDQLWFLNWTKFNKAKLANFNLYRCSNPATMYGVRLKDYHPTQESCTPKNPFIVLAIVISSVGSLLVLIILMLFKCQSNIKNYIYLVRLSLRRRQGYIKLDNADDFEYHAFVVYCDADRNWVHNTFLRKIEEEEGMKLCIHQRDFDVGRPIVENIDTFLMKSRKVVVVISNEFAKSEWCQWEVDVVQERRRREGRDVILPVVLKSINSKHMTSHLKTLLDSSTHLRYQKGIGEDLFWKALVEGLRKPIGQPPIALL